MQYMVTFSLHGLISFTQLLDCTLFDQKGWVDLGNSCTGYCTAACFTSKPFPAHTHTHTQSRLEELSHLWQELLDTSAEKRQKLQDAQKREHFLREADEVAAWISDREAVVSSEELGKDLEHVEMLQKNFADFLKVRFLPQILQCILFI